MNVSVCVVGSFNQILVYNHTCALEEGTIVRVPLQNRTVLGVVLPDVVEVHVELKDIAEVYPYQLTTEQMKFLNWMSAYTLIPRGMILKMILGEKTVFSVKKPKNIQNDELKSGLEVDFREIILNEEQQKTFEAIQQCEGRPFLLQGVTGSGKTEVYLKKAKQIFDSGRQVLIMFPEIALTNQIVLKIKRYLGVEPYIWTSNAGTRIRRDIWLKAISGEPCIIIGTRSALFIPFKNLGLIVMDEEHDSCYKQEEGPLYNARDMAVVLASIVKISIILSSATPSIESFVNAQSNKYGFYSIKNRYGVSKLPAMHLIDMTQNKFDGYISPPLYFAIHDRLARHEQSLIYLNRRGYAPITLCSKCGEKIACLNCSSWLVYHKNEDRLVCHYCGYKTPVPKKCQYCSAENSFIPFGPGVERIHEEIMRKFPEARIVLASSDTFASEKNMLDILSKINNNEVDIIIGTQILTKGHHFPNITLVGVVDGDLGLYGADLRASERTHQLIIQAAGRAGREEKPGEILIQTFKSNHPLFQALLSWNSEEFIDLEIENRKKFNLPPFSKFASLIISSTNDKLAEKISKILKDSCPKNITIFGPAPAPMFILRGRSRWRILLKSPKKNALNSEISNWLSKIKCPPSVRIQIDIDPISFL